MGHHQAEESIQILLQGSLSPCSLGELGDEDLLKQRAPCPGGDGQEREQGPHQGRELSRDRQGGKGRMQHGIIRDRPQPLGGLWVDVKALCPALSQAQSSA